VQVMEVVTNGARAKRQRSAEGLAAEQIEPAIGGRARLLSPRTSDRSAASKDLDRSCFSVKFI
jgi:hypothetical protein